MITDKSGEKTTAEFLALRAKIYAYRKIGKILEDNRCKGTKECAVTKLKT